MPLQNASCAMGKFAGCLACRNGGTQQQVSLHEVSYHCAEPPEGRLDTFGTLQHGKRLENLWHVICRLGVPTCLKDVQRVLFRGQPLWGQGSIVSTPSEGETPALVPMSSDPGPEQQLTRP